MRRIVKPACRILAVAVLAVVLIPPMMLAVRFGWKIRRTLPVFFHRCVLAIIGVRIEQHGTPDPRRPLLILSNHASWLDIIVISALTPVSFIAKSEVAGWPAIGFLARLQGSIFVERERRARTGAATAAIGKRLAGGDVIVLFAEGTTSDGVRVLPFRSALVGAAQAALIPGNGASLVQPLALRYARRNGLPLGRVEMADIAWVGDTDLAPHLLSILAGGPVDVVVRWGEAVAFEAGADRKALTRDAERAVRRLIAMRDPLASDAGKRAATAPS